MIRRFLTALGFLSRIGPARVASTDDLVSSVIFFPAAGAVIGAVVALPFVIHFLVGHPWAQAWIMLALSLYATRGLHWDGWADICDAAAGGATGDRFWDIIKDSRIGAFGAMGLFMGLIGQLLFLRLAAVNHAWEAVLWAFILGRGCIAPLAVLGRKLAKPGLAEAFTVGVSQQTALLTLAQIAAVGLLLVSPATFALSVLLAFAGLAELLALAKRRGGLNGDFYGAAVVWGELSVLLAWALTDESMEPFLLY